MSLPTSHARTMAVRRQGKLRYDVPTLRTFANWRKRFSTGSSGRAPGRQWDLSSARTPSGAVSQTTVMDRQTIAAGWLTLRPFTPADIPWVYEVSLDPLLQRFMQVPSPYRLEDAVSHVEQDYIAGWDEGRRAEFVAEDTVTAARLGRVGLCLGEPGAAEVGYWVDPRARKRGVATTAVRAVCQWAVTTAGIELIEWRCEAGNIASRRVAEKAGFLIEGTLRKRRVRHGVRVDEWVGSLLRDEVIANPTNAHR
jgi:RimJ/RimL family protein N-acetyltransferase